MISCQFEDGAKANLRHVVMDGIVICDGAILLIKRAPNLSEGGKYGLPGGYLDRDESTEDGVIREVLEETGWKVKVISLLGIDDALYRGDNRQSVSLLFHMEVVEKVGEPDHETIDVQWFPVDQLPTPDQLAFDHHRIIKTFIETTLQGKQYPSFLH